MINKALKKLVLGSFNFFGYRVIKNFEGGINIGRNYRNLDSSITILSFLKYYQPKILFDIGANNGAWTSTFYKHCNTLEKVVFFEPQRKYQKNLESLNLGNTSKTIFQCGLADNNDKLVIHGGNEVASFLELNERVPQLGEVLNEEEVVDVKVLDEMVRDHQLPFPDLIKVDVQGFELKVLRGAKNTIKNCKYLILELSFEEVYLTQEPLSNIFKFLEDNNFVLVDFGFEWRVDYKPSKRILQIDGIFANKMNALLN
jgi:FkbM family methyltransferase